MCIVFFKVKKKTRVSNILCNENRNEMPEQNLNLLRISSKIFHFSTENANFTKHFSFQCNPIFSLKNNQGERERKREK